MRTFSKLAAIALVAASFGALAETSQASVAVQYYTTNGKFTKEAGYTESGWDATGVTGFGSSSLFGTSLGTPSDTLSLSYNAQAATNASLTPGVPLPGKPFGTFTLTEVGTAAAGATATGIDFSFDLYQNTPGAANTPVGTFLGTVTLFSLTIQLKSNGQVTATSGAAATITFPSGEIFPFLPFTSPTNPPISYGLDGNSVPVLLSVAPTIAGSSDIEPLNGVLFTPNGGGGDPAPLPSVASLGMTMLGLAACGLAGRKLARRTAIA